MTVSAHTHRLIVGVGRRRQHQGLLAGDRPVEYAQPGTFVVTGTVEGTSLQARATVTVKEEM